MNDDDQQGPNEDQEKVILEAMHRMGDRLVETGFAKQFGTFTTLNRGAFELTDAGRRLKADIQKVFSPIHPDKIPPSTDFAALFLLLLISKPG